METKQNNQVTGGVATELRDALQLYYDLDNRRHAGIEPEDPDWAEAHQAAEYALARHVDVVDDCVAAIRQLARECGGIYRVGDRIFRLDDRSTLTCERLLEVQS